MMPRCARHPLPYQPPDCGRKTTESRRRAPAASLPSASGKLAGNRHLRHARSTPMSNLLLSMLDMLGVQQDSFGDSTGRLSI
jgi:hypothetical protein